MTSPRQTGSTQQGASVPRWLETGLLCVVLALVVLRTTIIEAPLVDQFQARSMLNTENMTLLLSTVLLACAGVWALAIIISGRLCWRRTGFGIAMALFIAAGIVSACFASNKRAAVTDLVTLGTPMLTGLLLVQWLNSAAKIRLALVAVLAVGAAATIQCVDQYTSSNENLIAEYEANPTEFLQNQGIEPETMEHWMFEHRMYSQDIRGFLMTSNSAATFFLMAIFAGLGLCVQLVRKNMPQQTLTVLVCYLLALLFVLAGLFLTQSKGGIGAFSLAVLLFVILLRFGRSIRKRRRWFGVAVLLLIVVAAGFINYYGTEHGRLPGGNSMLVRWQYWVSAGEMIRDHLLTGVGGGNFPDFYTHYKIPAALETVQNPHNWVLSLLSQYGVLGFAALAGAIFPVLFKAMAPSPAEEGSLSPTSPQSAGREWLGVLILSALLLLTVRPVLIDVEFASQQMHVAAAAYMFLYFIPALVFVLAFILLAKASGQHPSDDPNRWALSIALVCGLVAVLIHNLIDFALFEPGNWSVFWLFAAILIARRHNAKEPDEKTKPITLPKRLGLFAGLFIGGIAYLSVVLVPPLRAESLLRRAMLTSAGGVSLMDQAVDADRLSAGAPYLSANFLTQVYQSQTMNNPAFLERAEGFADMAIQRNPADFKGWRLRAKISVIRSEQTEGAVKQAALEKASRDLREAIARYPGSGKLNFLMANVAEQLGWDEVALSYYLTAVDIEDAYREQFKVMYPERETVISRLGESAYTEAKAKIEALKKHTP